MIYSRNIFAIVLSAFALAGCQSQVELPTLAVLPTDNALTEIATLPISQQTSAEPTTILEFMTPSTQDMATQVAAIAPYYTPDPSVENNTFVNSDIGFENLAVGDTISFLGILHVDDTTLSSHVTIILENNSIVQVVTPVDIVRPLDGRQVYISGTVVSVGDVIIVEPSAVNEITQTITPTYTVLAVPTLELNEAIAEASAEVTSVATISPFGEIEISPALTALRTFDELQPHIANSTIGQELIAISGNMSTGWSFTYYSSVSDDTMIYIVTPQGALQTMAGFPPVANEQFFPIDPRLLIVDSDRVAELYSQSGGQLDPTTLVFLLHAISNTTPKWTLLNAQGELLLTVDAISGDVTGS